ncbi:thymidylate synthase [Rhizobium sp. BK176]|uniref:thymidylate synthase n=1 Tax=Rhizobium sp. BK176 TaxID=2587071 RepID=UPI00386B6DDE
MLSVINHPERQYLRLIDNIVKNGSPRTDRTKVGTRALFGVQCRFDLSDGELPILTTKKVLWQAALKELLWFLKGETNIRPLLQEGVTIWTDWPLAKYRKATGHDIAQKDFEARVVEDEAFASEWGDLGPVYGKQWRRWRDYEGGEIDQVAGALNLIGHDPYSRRIIIEGWNVAELSQMALTPCHKSYQFFVTPSEERYGANGEYGGEHNAHLKGRKRLHLLMVQRSSDTILGVPFNWTTSSFLLHMMAHQADMDVGEFVWQSADTHVYDNHHDAVATQLAREPKGEFPRIAFKRKPDDIFSYKFEDFEVVGYDHHPFIKAEVAV